MYKFGQIRRNQISTFLTPLDYTTELEEQVSPLSEAVIFNEFVINCSLPNVDSTRTKKKNYFLRIKIYRDPEEDELVTVILKKKNGTIEDRTQTLGTLKIEKRRSEVAPLEYAIFDIVIPPNAEYDQILFKLNRTLIDYNIINMIDEEDPTSTETYGRILRTEIPLFAEINNVIDDLNPAIGNKGRLKQIGVQSAPGLQMCIDGEQVRVGRSGIYEINNGVNVQFLGFIIEPDNDGKYFLLDYQY